MIKDFAFGVTQVQWETLLLNFEHNIWEKIFHVNNFFACENKPL